MRIVHIIRWMDERFKRSRRPIVVGVVLLLLISGGLIYLIVTDQIRRPASEPSVPVTVVTATTSTPVLVSRYLDGVLVTKGEEAFMPRAVMVENQVDARPLSGPAKAQVVIEAPVEGGITRFLLFFDATTTVDEIGPVRSARPYFVDWAYGWKALYAHVGGSPEALSKISQLTSFANLDEMSSRGYAFWRATIRYAPHNTYTKSASLSQLLEEGGLTTSTAPISWHTQDPATTTERGDVVVIRIPYGGSYNVTWKYDAETGVYTRLQSGRTQQDKDGTLVGSENVIVLKTESQVLDAVGRLRLRTVGSGEAMAYRDGKKFPIRWRRSAGEPIKFEGNDGSEFLLTRGRTWLEITTDDRIFAGLEIK